MDSTFADSILGDLGSVDEWLYVHATTTVGLVLIACFSIAVGFVAYKLIKRALNKA